MVIGVRFIKLGSFLYHNMPKFKICFADSLPGEPGGGGPDNDFYAEHGFEGSAAEAIKRAEKISWKEYSGDFQWWIVEDPSVEIDLEEPVEKPQPRLYTPPSMSDELKKSRNVTYHHSREDLTSILNEPTYITISLFPPGVRDSIDFGYRNWEFHCIEFDLYNNDLLVDRGKQKPGSSSKPNNVTKSLLSVEEMIYKLNLAHGKQVSHVLRTEEYTDFHTKEFVGQHPLKIDVYDFQVNDELMGKYAKQHKDFLEEKEREFRSICERLETRGTTL